MPDDPLKILSEAGIECPEVEAWEANKPFRWYDAECGDAAILVLARLAANMADAGDGLFARYTRLVDSGDAGHWDWSEEDECKEWQRLRGRDA